MDLTGRFPKKSSRGNKYIMVVYNYDANYIHGLPLKNRKGAIIADTWQQLHNLFKFTSIAPEVYVLDNETSQELKDAFK